MVLSVLIAECNIQADKRDCSAPIMPKRDSCTRAINIVTSSIIRYTRAIVRQRYKDSYLSDIGA